MPDQPEPTLPDDDVERHMPFRHPRFGEAPTSKRIGRSL